MSLFTVNTDITPLTNEVKELNKNQREVIALLKEIRSLLVNEYSQIRDSLKNEYSQQNNLLQQLLNKK